MASYLSRIQWGVIRKSPLEFTRVVATASVHRRYGSTDSSSNKKQSRSFKTFFKRFLTFSLMIPGIGLVICILDEAFGDSTSKVKSDILPSAYAKTHLLDGQYKKKYNFIADVVEVVAPSVVYLEVLDSSKIDFFTGRPLNSSNGSGFIVHEDGLILTNAHVVVNKPNMVCKVRLHDGKTYTGVVEDVDMERDLATVRINKKNLPVMKLGNSANLRPGEFVVAIGSPLNLSNSITSGIVSTVNRQSEELGLHNKRMAYIQTDAAITFGNSGGPLVNLDGEAIGINVMKVTAGISFAIPVDYAKEFLKKAEARRRGVGPKNITDVKQKRFLGITMLSLTPDIIHEIQQKSGFSKTPITHGVLVWQVIIGSPAHRAGVYTGDVITHVNKEAVGSAVNIYTHLQKIGPLHFTIIRDGSVLNISVDPEEIN